MNILVINGANLNMLGVREPALYGTASYAALVKDIKKHAKEVGVKVKCVQYNCEGDIVTCIQKARNKYCGIVINAGGYTHTSVVIMDALKAVSLPVAEVHITDIDAREEYRRFSYISQVAFVKFAGLGFEGYNKAIDAVKQRVEEQK